LAVKVPIYPVEVTFHLEVSLSLNPSNQPHMQSQTILVKDRYFVPFISSEEIKGKISNLSARIKADVEGKNPLFVVVLNGAFVFASDLIRQFDFPLEIAFIRVASYSGTSTSGKVRAPALQVR
jgi:hypothetical protein